MESDGQRGRGMGRSGQVIGSQTMVKDLSFTSWKWKIAGFKPWSDHLKKRSSDSVYSTDLSATKK